MAEAAEVPTDRRYTTMKKIGLFAAGVLFDTAGLKILGCREAKKVYTGVTAAALRAKDCVMGCRDHRPGERRGYLRGRQGAE